MRRGLVRLYGGTNGTGVSQACLSLREAQDLIICFFADDSLLFCKAKEEDLTCIQETLDMYEKASGQIKQREDLDIFQLKH